VKLDSPVSTTPSAHTHSVNCELLRFILNDQGLCARVRTLGEGGKRERARGLLGTIKRQRVGERHDLVAKSAHCQFNGCQEKFGRGQSVGGIRRPWIG
jgi:hypothetical protein